MQQEWGFWFLKSRKEYFIDNNYGIVIVFFFHFIYNRIIQIYNWSASLYLHLLTSHNLLFIILWFSVQFKLADMAGKIIFSRLILRFEKKQDFLFLTNWILCVHFNFILVFNFFFVFVLLLWNLMYTFHFLN